jgi:hypothetical protein
MGMVVTPTTFLHHGKFILGRQNEGSAHCERRFRALFGCSWQTCNAIWHRCRLSVKAKPYHLLWALLFLKTYESEDVLCILVRTTRKTFRKWSWHVIGSIAAGAVTIVRRTTRVTKSILPLTRLIFIYFP